MGGSGVCPIVDGGLCCLTRLVNRQQRGFWFWAVQVVSSAVFIAWALVLLLFSWLAEGYGDDSSHSDWIRARVAVGLVAFALPLGIAVWRRNAAYLLLAVPVSLVLFVGADLLLP
jgi:hypothetical protein